MTHSGQSRTEEEQDGQTGAQREWHRMSAEQSLIGRVMKSWVRVCMCVFQSAHAYVCALRSVHDYVHLFACQLCQITWVRTEHGRKRTRVYRAASHLFVFTAMTHIQQTFKSYYRLRGLHQAESLDSIFINICPTWETWYDSDLGWRRETWGRMTEPPAKLDNCSICLNKWNLLFDIRQTCSL